MREGERDREKDCENVGGGAGGVGALVHMSKNEREVRGMRIE